MDDLRCAVSEIDPETGDILANSIKHNKGKGTGKYYVGTPALILAIDLTNKSVGIQDPELNRVDAIDILLNTPGINVNRHEDSTGRTALMAAAPYSQNMMLIHKLISKSMLSSEQNNVDDVDKRGKTALFYAADNFNYNNMNLLLTRGANLMHRNNEGLTPLEYILTRNKGVLSSNFNKNDYLDTIQFLVNKLKGRDGK